MIHCLPSRRRRVGSVVWTADGHDPWRTVTWTAAAVISLGSVLAVFGLLPVSVHGPLHSHGVMDPPCGATRAVRLALRGDLATSWQYTRSARCSFH